MKILIVYDSVFGNTEKVAFSLKEALLPSGNVIAVKADSIKPEDIENTGLLIIGSPTRAFNMTAPVKKLLKGFQNGGLKGIYAAAFDTRIDVDKSVKILKFFAGKFGYAAEKIAKTLSLKGARLIGNPQYFYVADKEGPLMNNQNKKASEWAEALLKEIQN